ncbi:MAG: type VI secretion system tip protein VgrG [Chitinophagaceae bacterium]
MSDIRTIPSDPAAASVVTFTVKIGGEAIPRTFNVASAVINRSINRITSLDLAILDGDAASSGFPASDDVLFVPGKAIELWGGFSSQETVLFKGIIIKHSLRIREDSSPMLMIDARDKAVKMTVGAKNHYYENKKDSEIIEDLAGTYGLDKDIETTTVQHKQLLQYNCTDWDFIQTRAESNGQFCYAENGKLVVKKPDLSPDAAVELLFGATIISFDAEMDARYQYDTVTTTSWSHDDQAIVNADSADPGITEQGDFTSADLAAIINSEPYTIQHGGSVEEAELQARADAQLLKSRLAKIRGRVKFRGFGAVMPGNTVLLNGVGKRFTGKVFVSGVRHEFYNGNWTSDVQFGVSPQWFAKENDIQPLPAAGMVPGIKGLQIGVVTNLEDPDGMFRVKVKIPDVSMDDEGMWCRVATPDAGKNRGLFFRPEVGDEVIVGFLHEDPNHGVILGGVFSSAMPSPISQTADNNEKGLMTRSEMKWIWNDDKKSLTIETPGGKKMVVDEDADEMKWEDEHGNKILMNADGITIESAKALTLKAATDWKGEGLNVALKGSSACKIEGSASTELSSGGATTVKGTVVNIN